MSIVLFRVDERLIHGQVVVGWAELHPNRIVVVDDDIADSQWEQELYAMGLPSEVASEFEPVAAARAMLAEWRRGNERVIVLTRDLATYVPTWAYEFAARTGPGLQPISGTSGARATPRNWRTCSPASTTASPSPRAPACR